MSRPTSFNGRHGQIAQYQDIPTGKDHLQQQQKAIGESPITSVRQPFGVKNVMSPSHEANNGGISLNTDKGYAKDGKSSVQQPQNASIGKFHRFLANQHGKSGSSNQHGSAAVSHSTLYASHAPSPLGAMHRQKVASRRQGLMDDDRENISSSAAQSSATADRTDSRSNAVAVSPVAVKTPRKRAVPLEDVHCRNVVDDPAVHKRSRSSRDGGTSSSISAAIDNVNLRSGDNVASKTVRIARLTQNDRAQRDARRAMTTMEWRKRFLRAFPAFRFYLDGFDAAAKAEMMSIIASLGGHVEPFFSNTVTHLVTARKVSLPPAEDTGDVMIAKTSTQTSTNANTRGDQVLGSSSSNTAAVGRDASMFTAGRGTSRFATMRKKNTSVPLRSERNPFDEWAPPVPANDILVKARNFGIKVWGLDKFNAVTAGLTGGENALESNITEPNKMQQIPLTPQAQQKQPTHPVNVPTGVQSNQLLSRLLAKEKVQGTHERDPKAARTDFHYFSRNSVYALVEDATGEHRPILAQEWRKPSRDDEDIPWPVLFGELEGRCPFTKFAVDGDPRKRMRPNRHETLRRSVSLNHMRSQHRNASMSPAPSNDSRGGYSVTRGASPYPLASGNSVSVASTNITSTTSAAAAGMHGNSLGLLSPFHPMARKTTTGIGLGRPTSLPHNAPQAKETKQASNDPMRGSLVRRMLGMTDGKAPSAVASALPSHLQQNNGTGIRRSVSTPSTTAAGTQVAREKRPGYCENCRLKYDDFDEHVLCRRHRKFATDDGNFAEIDDLLRRINRPIATWAIEVSIKSDTSDALSHSDGFGGDRESGEMEYDSTYDSGSMRGHAQLSDTIEQQDKNIVQECISVDASTAPNDRAEDGRRSFHIDLTKDDDSDANSTTQRLLDVVESWQRDAVSARPLEKTKGSSCLDDVPRVMNDHEQQLASAAAAFRIQTGLDRSRSITGTTHEQGAEIVEGTSTSSPGTPSCAVTIDHRTEESAATLSPHTSPHLTVLEHLPSALDKRAAASYDG